LLPWVTFAFNWRTDLQPARKCFVWPRIKTHVKQYSALYTDSDTARNKCLELLQSGSTM